MSGFRDLEIYTESFDLALKIRKASLQLNNSDRFEIGAQIRRSSTSIFSNIAEGYGRKDYKAEFIRFLNISYASTQEALSQADFLFEATKMEEWKNIAEDLDKLGMRIYNFINYVKANYK
jgi:four helix bundle protein